MATSDDREDRDVAASWDHHAEGWDKQVGEEGDRNRILNSDPALMRLLGAVRGLRVLDAGCGTGYLSRRLARQGAVVTGVDISPRMIDIARARTAEAGLAATFLVDSCSVLSGVPDGSCDRVAANYVLMDLSDLAGALRAFFRVLVPGGCAVVVFSHPCFPQGQQVTTPGGVVTYAWSWNYFEDTRREDPPWAHFRQQFSDSSHFIDACRKRIFRLSWPKPPVFMRVYSF